MGLEDKYSIWKEMDSDNTDIQRFANWMFYEQNIVSEGITTNPNAVKAVTINKATKMSNQSAQL